MNPAHVRDIVVMLPWAVLTVLVLAGGITRCAELTEIGLIALPVCALLAGLLLMLLQALGVAARLVGS